jgi:RHS repeat-associated protein
MTDPDNKVWQYGYDDSGLQTRLQDPLGNVTTWLFDSVGRIESMTTPAGNATPTTPPNHTYNYLTDAFGQITQTTDPLQHVTSAQYDPDGNLQTSTDANSNTTTNVYDDADQLTSTQRPGASTTQTSYWPDGSLKAQTDGAGYATNYDYDPLGRLTRVTDPDNRAQTYTYNTDGQMLTDQSPGGACSASSPVGCTTYNYDPTTGQLTSITYAPTTSGVATPAVTGISYDAYGNRTAMTDGTGTSTWSWDSLGRLTSGTDGAHNTVAYSYDGRSLLTAIAYPGGTLTGGVCTTGTHCVTRGYDDAGHWTSVQDWAGHTTYFGYDADSNEHTITYPSGTGDIDTFNFDDTDHLSSISYTQGSTTLGTVSYSRLHGGELSGQTQTGLPGDSTDTYGYSSIDQLCWTNPTSITSNASNTSACSSSPSGSSTFGYDTADNLTKLATGPSLGYDKANQLCWSSPSGASGSGEGATCAASTPPTDATTYGYDDSGNRTSGTPASGPGSTFSYDGANRMTSATVPNWATWNSGQYTSVTPASIYNTSNVSGTVTITVAGNGGIPTGQASAVALNVDVSSSTGSGTATVYRANGSLPATPNVTFTSGQDAQNLVVTKLSTAGAIKVTLSSGITAHVSVTVLGWYTKAFDNTGTVFTPSDPTMLVQTGSSGQVGACPDNASQCTTISSGASLTVQVTGQAGVPTTGVSAVALNVVSIDNTSTGLVFAYPTGTTPTNGMAVHDGTAPGNGMDFVPVSSSGRITLFNYSSTSTDVIASIEGWYGNGASNADIYTPADPTRILNTATGTGTCTPSPCVALSTNSSIAVAVAGQGAVPATGVKAVMADITVTAPTGVSGLLSTQSNTDPTATGIDMVIPAGQTTALDTIIPLGTDGAVKLSAGWNSGAVNVTVDIQGWYTPADATWTYSYNGDGLRTTKAGNGATTSFVWDAAEPLPAALQEATGTSTTYYVFGPGGLPVEQINADGTIDYLHHDQLGSTRLLTSSSGATVGAETYDPYGDPTGITGTATTPYGYAGSYTDTETGYQYDHARYYDPTTGQFLTRDPLATTTRAAYGYAGGNPLTQIDPQGLSSCGDWTDPGAYVDCGAKAAKILAAMARVPDYLVMDASNFFSLFGSDAGFGPGVEVVVSRSGHVFAGPEGGFGEPGDSEALRFGWLLQRNQPSGCDVDKFIRGLGMTNEYTFGDSELGGLNIAMTTSENAQGHLENGIEVGPGHGQSSGNVSLNYLFELDLTVPSW